MKMLFDVLFVLLSFHFNVDGVLSLVSTDDDVSAAFDTICISSNEYLVAMHRCRPDDFQTLTICSPWHQTDISCAHKTQKIAVFTSVVGRNEAALNCSRQVSPRSTSAKSTFSAATLGDCCAITRAETRCHGKSKCHLSDDLISNNNGGGMLCTGIEGDRSPSTYQSRSLTVVYICVFPKIMRELKRDRSNPDDFCDGVAAADNLLLLLPEETAPSANSSNNNRPVDIILPITSRTETSSSLMTSNGDLQLTTRSFGSTSRPVNGRSDDGRLASEAVTRASDAAALNWMWSIMFITENLDRLLVYFFLGVAVGVIFILIVIILRLCILRHHKTTRQRRNHLIISGPQKQSSTQTPPAEDTAALIPTNRIAGIEMVRYAHTGTLQSHPQPFNYYGGEASPLAPVTDGDTVPPERNRFVRGTDPSPAYTINGNVPVRSSNGGYNADGSRWRSSEDELDANVVEENRSNTLGRFYTNPYRHDTYRTDGMKTLRK